MLEFKYIEEFDDKDTDDVFFNELTAYDERSGSSWCRIHKGNDLSRIGEPVLLYKSDIDCDGYGVHHPGPKGWDFDIYMQPELLAANIKDADLRRQIAEKGGFYRVLIDSPLHREGVTTCESWRMMCFNLLPDPGGTYDVTGDASCRMGIAVSERIFL